MTYKEEIEAGTATDDMFLDLVDEWHQSGGIQELHTFLGFDSLDEYDRAARPEVYEN